MKKAIVTQKFLSRLPDKRLTLHVMKNEIEKDFCNSIHLHLINSYLTYMSFYIVAHPMNSFKSN